MKKYKWCRTDTASVMFSAIDSKNQSRICRYSAVLKDEEIDPVRLEEAVKRVAKRYPQFMQRGKKGFFWGYLEQSDMLPEIKKETLRPAALRRLGKNGGPELEILYYKRRISVDGSHILADGNGYTEFLKSLVAEYLILGGMNRADFDGIRLSDEPPKSIESENAYIRYFNKQKLKKATRDTAYILPKNYEEDYVNSIFGLINIEQLKEKCHEKSMTITEYLGCALIYAAIKSAPKPVDKTVIIAVPVNMRKYFPTDTVRNFTNDVPLQFNAQSRENVSFDEICNAVRGQLKKNNTQETMQAFINSAYGMTQNPLLRAIPFFVKHAGMNKIQQISHNKEMTVMLSNIGNVTLPPEMAKKVERLDFIGGDVRVYDLPMFCSVIGVNGYLNFCFSVNGKDVSLCREFFRLLSDQGVKIRVESSDENGAKDCKADEIYPKHCPHCDVEISEEYTICPLCGEKAQKSENVDTYFKTASFPAVYGKPTNEKAVKPATGFSFEKVKAYFNF